jgi:group I intron endonuclease
MSSGIYKLTFSNGSVYIGKSSNIDKRWSQHGKAMSKGTHTKKIQECYEKYGEPLYEVVFECHPDHIDIMENYFISLYWSDSILNTTKPFDLTKEDKDTLNSVNRTVWNISTFDHLRNWLRVQKELERSNTTLMDIKSGSLVEELEEDVEVLQELLDDSRAEIKRLKSRGLFARIFNL